MKDRWLEDFLKRHQARTWSNFAYFLIQLITLVTLIIGGILFLTLFS
jgi:hypothetical protein